MFLRGLLTQPLSPLIDMDKLTNLTDAAFYGNAENNTMGFMGDWVQEAMSKDFTQDKPRHHERPGRQVRRKVQPLGRKVLR
mmetsp:Transcript_7089/g.24396  ORF Transcript_7089/g.24396 Transcript_7089/m.24396 type:complete len:81 (-) Transcript_7089:2538-2780(-)